MLQLVFINLQLSETFILTGKLLENRILELQSQGKRPKGFVLISPHNPMGDIYSQDLIMDLLNICRK